ncbi:MAG TPA: hypothetical protein PKD90_07705 [Phnomibacter sp.]|nr:hypothetical protein [Phnomibacter sp.]
MMHPQLAKKLILLIWYLNLLPLYIWAQTPVSKSLQPFAMADVNLMTGAYEPAAAFNIRGGLQHKNWQWGLSGGIDTYRFTSIPVLAGVQYKMGAKKHGPIMHAAGGINIAAVTEQQKNYNYGFGPQWRRPWSSLWMPADIPASYRNGYAAEAGAGYAFYGKRGHGVQLSVVYSLKTMQERYPANAFAGYDEVIPYTERLFYRMHRTMVRVAYKW